MKTAINIKTIPAQHINNQWLAFLRVAVPALVLIQFLSILPDFENIFTFNGYVKPDVLDASLDNFSFTIYDCFTFIKSAIPSVEYNTVLYFTCGLFIFSLLSLCAGFLTRGSAVLSALTHLLLMKSIHLYEYGADFFMTILLFYCAVFPVGRVCSVDNKIFKARKTPIISHVSWLRILQIHICIAYCVSGIDKVLGFNWHNGEAIWKATTSFNQLGLVNVTSLAPYPVIFIMVGWMTIITEMLYPIFINIRKTRKIWLLLTISMHLGIILLLGLFFFSTIMIIFNLAAYYVPYMKPEKEKKSAPGPTVLTPALTTH